MMSTPPDRRTFLKSVGLTTAAASLARGAGAAEAGPGAAEAGAAGGGPRNVLVYVVDDQGRDDAGCYGNPVIKTPGLDRLAENGIRLTNGFCTSASCSASRSVILSGLYNHASGQYGHQHDCHHFAAFDDVRSLPVLLAEAGYRTCSAGKYHVAPESVFHFGEYVPIRGRSPKAMADACRDFIARDDSPFFLYFCTTEPHRPFRREGSDPVDPKDVIVPSYLPDIPECREELAKYYGSVQRCDTGLLRLIDILNETGHWDDTLIIYVSDNGIAFPGAKTTLYDPGMHLPAVVRNPHQARAGGACNAMITWADITPTVLDYVGATPEGAMPEGAAFHGRSFLAALEQENPAGWDEIYASHTFHEITMYYPMRVVQNRQYKLIWNIAHGLDYPFASDLWESDTWQGVVRRGLDTFGKRPVDAYLKRPAFELYDMQADPDEVHNLAEDPGHAAVLTELKDRLRAFQERTDDPWIVKWEHE
ncbi:MAG: sulfatase [Candidatus Hydrogenedentes bacterium]|nr:sulfatase [Candidatus Hydrogenedentota bacterium]